MEGHSPEKGPGLSPVRAFVLTPPEPLSASSNFLGATDWAATTKGPHLAIQGGVSPPTLPAAPFLCPLCQPVGSLTTNGSLPVYCWSICDRLVNK